MKLLSKLSISKVNQLQACGCTFCGSPSKPDMPCLPCENGRPLCGDQLIATKSPETKGSNHPPRRNRKQRDHEEAWHEASGSYFHQNSNEITLYFSYTTRFFHWQNCRIWIAYVYIHTYTHSNMENNSPVMLRGFRMCILYPAPKRGDDNLDVM